MEPKPAIPFFRILIGVILLAAVAGLAALAWSQHQTIAQLRREQMSLNENAAELQRLRAEARDNPVAGLQAELDRLREENKDLLRLRAEVTRLRAGGTNTLSASSNATRQLAEIERLREDNKDVLRLRNEISRLREQAAEAEVLRAANTRLLQIVQDNGASNTMASLTAVRKQGSILGVQINPTPPGAQAYRGAMVAGVMPDAPAAQSDLKPGDIIIGLDGRAIESGTQLQVEMLSKKPGETVVLDVMRNNEPRRVAVQTRAFPE